MNSLFNMIDKLPMSIVFDLNKEPTKFKGNTTMFEVITSETNKNIDFVDYISNFDICNDILIIANSINKFDPRYIITERGTIGIKAGYDINLSNCKSTVSNTVNINDFNFDIRIICPFNIMWEIKRPFNNTFINDIVTTSIMTTQSEEIDSSNKSIERYNRFENIKARINVSLEEHVKTNKTYTLPKDCIIGELIFTNIVTVNTFNNMIKVNKIAVIDNADIYENISEYI